MITVTEAKRLEEKSKIWTKEDDDFVNKKLWEIENSIINACLNGANIANHIVDFDCVRPENIRKLVKEEIISKLSSLDYKVHWHGSNNRILQIQW